MKYGLIGEHLPHSFSKDIHERLGEYTYELHEVEPAKLDAFMKAKDFSGINVTIPYKQDVIPYLDEIDDAARAIGAVNCIVNKAGRLYGYNTDFAGMKSLVSRLGLDLAGKKVLILGTGGTSKTARALAQQLGAACVLRTSRSIKEGDDTHDVISYDQAHAQHADAQIIINTTPCGMYPNNGSAALDIHRFSQLEGVIDAVYNPLESALVLDAAEQGIPAEGGLYMLVAQAIYAAEYFLDRTLDKQALIDSIFGQIDAQKRNIVLIGMPGCGKSTVGKMIARYLKREFVDTDDLVKKAAGMPIAQIMEQKGQTGFRDIESSAVAEVGKRSGLVIATGGGAILRAENRRALKQNGRIFFVNRPLAHILPTDDRPLSNSPDKLRKLYDERYPLYTAFADHVIDASGSKLSVAIAIEERHFS